MKTSRKSPTMSEKRHHIPLKCSGCITKTNLHSLKGEGTVGTHKGGFLLVFQIGYMGT